MQILNMPYSSNFNIIMNSNHIKSISHTSIKSKFTIWYDGHEKTSCLMSDIIFDVCMCVCVRTNHLCKLRYLSSSSRPYTRMRKTDVWNYDHLLLQLLHCGVACMSVIQINVCKSILIFHHLRFLRENWLGNAYRHGKYFIIESLSKAS